jgi:hypothetical protein
MMDWDLWVHYLARYGQKHVLRISDVLAHYRHHAAAKTTTASSQFYDEAKVVFHSLHLALDAPKPYLFEDVEQMKCWHRRAFALGPDFNRQRYFGAYAERMVRIYRRKDCARAKAWLARAWAHKPWMTPWRVRMAACALFWK